MPTLRALIADHTPLLLIDSASSTVQVGLLRANEAPLWESSTAEAGSAIFTCAEKLLACASLPVAGIQAFVFCDGPGSVLGIRTAAMALRTWGVLHQRPAYSFCSLAAVAHSLARTENARNVSVIADARRETWHRVAIDAAGRIGPLQRVASAALSGSLVMPEGFRTWTALPGSVRSVPYGLATLLPKVDDVPLFDEAREPDAFLHEEPSYQTWTPQVHRAPA